MNSEEHFPENVEDFGKQAKVETDPSDLIKAELTECKDKYLRTLAEMENMRKRMVKEKQESLRYATDSLMAEFLAPLDNFENALKIAETGQVSTEIKNWALGFQMILGQLRDVLSQNGVNAFSSKGKTFDPHRHQAIEIEETDAHPEGYIIEEFVKGYEREDRTIRPARVKVATAKKTTKEENKEGSN